MFLLRKKVTRFRPIWTVVICGLMATSSLWAAQIQNPGSSAPGAISGIVLNEKGQPVPVALVNVDAGEPTISAIRYYLTDKKGHFAIEHLPLGNYKVFAQKESDGYPDLSWAFYSNNVFPVVSLTKSSPKVVVTVQIGPPCGVLHYSATDASTGRAIDAAITLRRASNPKLFIGGSNISNQILVPSLTDVLLQITAKGYKSWPPETEKATLGIINLKPHEIYNLNVKLQAEESTSVQNNNK